MDKRHQNYLYSFCVTLDLVTFMGVGMKTKEAKSYVIYNVINYVTKKEKQRTQPCIAIIQW